MVIASYTTTGQNYDVVLNTNGEADSCTCSDHKYRGHKPGHICKHRINASGQVMAEIEKAERFLALKSEIEKKERESRETAESNMRMFYQPW